MPGIPDPKTAFAVTGQVITYTVTLGSVVFIIISIAYSLIHRFRLLPRIYSPRTFLCPNRTPMEK